MAVVQAVKWTVDFKKYVFGAVVEARRMSSGGRRRMGYSDVCTVTARRAQDMKAFPAKDQMIAISQRELGLTLLAEEMAKRRTVLSRVVVVLARQESKVYGLNR